ncbi:MAG TPA: DNA polymerase III subunit delta [Saprospiraceae bacterium]|nr:DNA polymerase III subunit delta [Saprospiraceae bacterium]
MTHEDIIKDIKQGKFHPVYFLHGDEPYFIDVVSDYIEKNVLTEGEKAFNQVVVYGKDTEFKTIIDEARQFPMMSSYRVIILKEAQDMKTLQDLASYVEKPSNQSILVICHKYKKVDKRTKFAKLLDSKAVVFESKKLYQDKIAPWITSYIRNLGHTIQPAAADLLSEYLGSDLSKITNEVDKLVLNVKKGESITIEDVKDQIGVSKDFDVFELQKALGEKNFAKSSLIVRYFSENASANHPVVIVGSLYSYFNKVFITAMNAKESDQNLAKLLGLGTAFFVKDYKVAANNYPPSQLKKVFQALKKADLNSKGVGVRRGENSAIYKDILIACMGY